MRPKGYLPFFDQEYVVPLTSVAMRTAFLPSSNDTQVPERELGVAGRFRQLAGQLGRAWALAAGYDNLSDVHDEVRFYEEVRIWMAKYDAAEREARGEPVPEEVARLLRQLAAEATASGDVVDIHAAAEIAPPDFNDLTPAVLAQAQKSANPHLAIEALRDAILAEAVRSAGTSIVRQRAFSERLARSW